ncbi:putative peroxin 11c protein [Diplogelasinospora grovesii]|uniref:Peroxin 11c protein n=1 Tax=Diplogelasinospora grovesii TaxID=303347 RepID=A0AAN6MXT7_9PEZI|nr:putative peroxin 11c protein [Diplogelasinospora grovesii]
MASEAIADLPTGEPIPMPTTDVSAPEPKPTPKRSPTNLSAMLTTAPSKLDAFLARLNKCLSTPSGIDTVLLFICYTSRFSASILGRLSESALRRSAKEWIALVSTLPPKTTILFKTSPISSSSSSPSVTQLSQTATAAAALVLSRRLKALSTLLSEARMILRLWGLLGMYFWAKSLIVKTKHQSSDSPTESKKSLVETAISWTQLLTCIIFQALENGAYLSSKGALGWDAKTQASAYKWSARFWSLYTGVELGRLAAEALNPNKTAAVNSWRKQVARNLAWAPLTVHWSMDKGFVPEAMVGLLGSIPGIIQMRELWAENA